MAHVTIELPPQVYTKLESLAAEGGTAPAEIVLRLIESAYQQRAWQRDLAALRELIAQEGELVGAATRAEIVEQLRQTRQAIFAAEYAHLYR
jgi:predicted transcriptional regulator